MLLLKAVNDYVLSILKRKRHKIKTYYYGVRQNYFKLILFRDIYKSYVHRVDFKKNANHTFYRNINII